MDREQAYQEYVAKFEPYNAAIRAAGDVPWFEKHPDPEAARRELFFRRFRQPSAPVAVTGKSMPEIRGEHNEWN
ncbi:hypothetical protein ACWF82_15155 [Nocardia sp. NPDC055053]